MLWNHHCVYRYIHIYGHPFHSLEPFNKWMYIHPCYKQAAKLLSCLWDLAQTVWQIPVCYAPVRHFVFNYSIDENNVQLACVKHIASVHTYICTSYEMLHVCTYTSDLIQNGEESIYVCKRGR